MAPRFVLRDCDIWQWPPVLMAIGVLASLSIPQGWASQPLEPGEITTFYLTEGRRCRRCYYQPLDGQSVILKNLTGESAVYPVREIIGIDKHRFWRRLYRRHLKETGLATDIIVPEHTDDFDALNFPDPPPGDQSW